MLTALEIEAARTAVLTSVLVLTVTFVAGGIYWQHTGRLEQRKPLDGIKEAMPSFAKKYADADIQKIVAYLLTLR
jgi:hypothetical protein